MVGVRVTVGVLVGAGVASVQKNVTYTISGNDVTDNLAQYGIVLGTGLALDQAMTRVILPVLFVITLVPGLISVLHDMELLGIGRK
jgi:hypothetical protein